MTEVIFTFDTEDYTNPGADDAILRLAELLREEGIRASFNIVAALAEALPARGRQDVVEALRFHEINYHTYRHSWHPVAVEYSDTPDWDGPYRRLVAEEGPGIELVKRVFGRERLYAMVPAGNCVTAQGLYAYPALGLPLNVGSFPIRGTKGQNIYYGGALYVENNAFWDSLLLREGLQGVLQRMDEWRTWDRLVICMHPNLTYYPVFWDALNMTGENQVEWGQWRLAERRPGAEIEQFYTDFHAAILAFKRDPHFTFITFQQVLEDQKPRRALSPVDLDALLEAVGRRFFFTSLGADTYSLAEIFWGCVYFLNGGSGDYQPEVTGGPTAEPVGVSAPTLLSAAEIRAAAVRLADTRSADPGITAVRFVPSQVQAGSQQIGPRDFMEAARAILNGEAEVEVTPRSQEPEMGAFYHLDEAHLAGTWLYSPDFKDEWVSRRLKWQAWTIHL